MVFVELLMLKDAYQVHTAHVTQNECLPLAYSVSQKRGWQCVDTAHSSTMGFVICIEGWPRVLALVVVCLSLKQSTVVGGTLGRI